MDTRKDDVIGLLQEIEKQHEEQTEALKKQLFLTRIAALAGCVLTAGILVALLLLVRGCAPDTEDAYRGFGDSGRGG